MSGMPGIDLCPRPIAGMSNATLAALDVIEASLDEQLDHWQVCMIWSDKVENCAREVRLKTDGSWVELSGISVTVPRRLRKRLRRAVERWAARKAVASFKATAA